MYFEEKVRLLIFHFQGDIIWITAVNVHTCYMEEVKVMYISGIDRKDNEIIDLLLADGRMSYSDIGAKVGLSRTAVKNRIKVLEERNIISGYKAVINPQEAPEMMTFLLNAETSPECFDEVKSLLAESDRTVMLIQTTGKCHLTAFCVAPDMKAMTAFVNEMYKASDGISYISAVAVMDVIKGSVIPER